MRVPTCCRGTLIALTLALGACGSSPAPAPGPTTFSQADLTGTWDRVWFNTASAAGWTLHTMAIDGAGQVTFNACLTPAGTCTVTGTLTYTLDANGVVTPTGTAANPTLRAVMTSSKTLMFATATVPGTTGVATGYSLQIFRKRVPGVTFTSTDVANLQFAYHSIHSGTGTNWERGAGTTDQAGWIWQTFLETSLAGPPLLPPPGFDRIQVDANGLVTLANNPSFHGVMSADKKGIFGVVTTTASPPEYALMVLLSTGSTFAQSDLAGSYDFHMLTSGPTVTASSWLRGVLDISAAGAVTFPSASNPGGPTTLTGFNLTLDPTGAITRSDLPSYRGQMASGKDYFVRTQTGSGANSLAIVAR